MMLIDQFVETIKDYIPRNGYLTIFDVGSRDCEQSIEFSKKYPNANIYAFECNPNTIPICMDKIKSYSNITLVDKAVHEYNGLCKFNVIDPEKTHVQNEIEVGCLRLDTYMNSNNINRVDLLWMDLQGAELLALKGMGEFIKTVKFIHTEGQVMFDELNSYLLNCGFIPLNKPKEDIIYINNLIYNNSLFDIVIPVGLNDISYIHQTLKYTKQNVIGYRNIYLVAPDVNVSSDNTVTISENIFPFVQQVRKICGQGRAGWYLQQLIKLYAGDIVPGLTSRYLVLDSDVCLLKPIKFVDDHKFLLTIGHEYHLPYFKHMEKLHPSLIKMDHSKSGISHHMMLDTRYIHELMSLIENHTQQEMWSAFLSNVVDFNDSGASEYEIYFNFMVRYHPEQIIVRELNWRNADDIIDGYDYVAVHYYIRKFMEK